MTAENEEDTIPTQEEVKRWRAQTEARRVELFGKKDGKLSLSETRMAEAKNNGFWNRERMRRP